jgi:hypothetical protein
MYEVQDENSSRHRNPKRNVFSLAAKTTITEEVMKKQRSPGPIYYVS